LHNFSFIHPLPSQILSRNIKRRGMKRRCAENS
jgi:hypothetical protein